MTDRPNAQARPSLSSGLGFAGASFVVSTVLAIGSSLLLARLFGIEVVGETALAMAPLGALTFLSTVREQPAFVRLVAVMRPKDPDITGLFLAVFGLSTVLTCAASAIVVAGTIYAFNGPIDQPDLIGPAITYVLGYLLFMNVAWNLDSVFAAFGDGRSLFSVRTHQAIALIAGYVVASLIERSVWAVAIATVVSWIPPVIHRLVLVPRWMSWRTTRASLRKGRSALREIVFFGLKMTPGSLASGVSVEAGTWLLGASSTVSAVGAYSRAWTLARRLTEVTWRISEILMPTLVSRRAQGDQRGFVRAYAETMRWATSGMLLIAAAAGGAASSIMWLFGPEFQVASTALAVMLFIPVPMTISTLQSDALVAIGRPGLVSWLAVGGMVVTVGVSVALTPAWGINGPAVGMLAGALVRMALGAVAVRRAVGIGLRAGWPLRYQAAAGVAYAVGLGASVLPSLLVPELLALPLGLVFGASGFVLTLLATRSFGRADLARLRALRSKA